MCVCMLSTRKMYAFINLGMAYLEFACLSSSSMEQTFLKESLVYGLLPVLLVLLVFAGSLLSVGCRFLSHTKPNPWIPVYV